MSRRRPLLAVMVVASMGLAACGDDAPGGQGDGDAAGGTPGELVAQVASYDLAAGAPQRFLVGLVGADGGDIVGGEVRLDFRYLGADSEETSEAGGGEVAFADVRAGFLPVADGTAPDAEAEPRLREGGEGVGVYEASEVTFDRPGFWEVTVHTTVGGDDVEVAAAFQVLAEHQIVDAGDPAPRTENLLPGDPDAPPTAIDSRAEDDGTVPDPELHRLTVADAIATGRPTVVVVSTPVFCVSRFCGPITDSIQALAGEHGDRANFVHIEVWRDFEAKVVNEGAAEWIYPDPSVDAREPWVFLIDGDGTVVRRWDNVANQRQVDEALGELVG
ncbi:MAG: hypothetical protein ACLFXM_09045 [Acidimicrobiia bacterium]